MQPPAVFGMLAEVEVVVVGPFASGAANEIAGYSVDEGTRSLMNRLLDALGVELPIVQAGMGGGLAGHLLAAAVSEAGGLGTIGMGAPATLDAEIRASRELTSKPISVNVLLPFARPAHWVAANRADVVVTFWGPPIRHGAATWIHQCGTVEEALAAHAAGADAVIVQGVESGGHVRGKSSVMDLFDQTRAALPQDFPILIAGGVATAADVRDALAVGATAAVAGTRFLMSEESGASRGYKQRLVAGSDTVLTELFGLGWPAQHRVLPNAATDRWLQRDPLGPPSVRFLNRATAPVLARVPESVQARLLRYQFAGVPFYAPNPPSDGTPERMLDVSPLYAGETVSRIHSIAPAGEIVRQLTG